MDLSIEEKIQKAKEKKSTTLDLGFKDLNHLVLPELPYLRSLNVCGNRLKDLSFLEKTPKLFSLDISDNKLNRLILPELPSLVSLNLSANHLDKLILPQLPKLSSLNISRNQFRKLTLPELPKLISLDLSDNHLSQLALPKLPSLTSLNVSENLLIRLVLSELPKLASLNVSGNQLNQLILSKLKNLISLNVSANQLEQLILPELPKLSFLDLSDNRLEQLALSKLPSLTSLNVSENLLIRLVLSELPKLASLNVSGNQLNQLILPELLNLASLEISNNQLNHLTLPELPSLVSLEISNNQLSHLTLPELPSLVSLEISNNQLSQLILPQLSNLTYIDVSDNRISNLSFINTLPRLQILYFDNNPIHTPPLEIISQGLHAIKDYFESGQLIQFYEAKIILLGNGEVGKTTIRENLARYGNWPFYGAPEQQRTILLDISPWNLKIQNQIMPNSSAKSEIFFQFNIWDFGGQGPHRVIQQFFCSRTSLYLYVTSPDDKEINQKDDYIGLAYWVPFITSFGYTPANGHNPEHKSPILCIYNKSDSIPSHLNKKVVIGNIIEEAQKYNLNIVDGMLLECTNRDDIDELVEQIQKLIPRISYDIFTRRFSKNWLAVKTTLESLPDDYISLNQYKSIFAANNTYNNLQTDQLESQAMTWLNVLNTIGSVIHFENLQGLHDIIILKPEWVRKAACNVLDYQRAKNNYGKIEKEDFVKIWPSSEFKKSDRKKLIELMRAFELCYETTDEYGNSIYFIPELFPNIHPNTFEEFKNITKTPPLQFEFKFNPFMPAGVLHKIIVRNHFDIFRNCKWRKGVVLEDHNGNYIFIEEDWENRKLKVNVSGYNPESLYLRIYSEVKNINRTLKETKFLHELDFTVSVMHNFKWYELRDLHDLNFTEYKKFKA
ncbi:COR domain-containing protein [Xanthocytophaga agilis]|uniref:COR domain-containing protein n=1 Tax=Xanthocytophaga agilis TaxID=3048010 RepID=A0AAE3UF73_9BACT|nr:COR domain-containing protein [Xanthocytophaga agilis]MDJ1503548.1 COR domain-containing protein [Xanthocytophaga agilis]